MAVSDVQKQEIREALETIEANYVPYADAAQSLGTHLAYARTLISNFQEPEPDGVDVIHLHGKPLIRREFLDEIQVARAEQAEQREAQKAEKVEEKERRMQERQARIEERERLRQEKAARKLAEAEARAAAKDAEVQAKLEAKAAKAKAALEARTAQKTETETPEAPETDVVDEEQPVLETEPA